MSADIIPFDFEEHAVRVILRGGEPWFVAADVCRVLEIANPSDALKRLDDDETEMVDLNTLDTTEGIRGNPNARIINESGLYALVLTSRKAQARRFRKWITAEVLPAIRRTGRYDPALAAPEPEGEIAGMPLREAELWLQMVREARLSRGTKAAVAIWDRSPLPKVGVAVKADPSDPGQGYACLRHIMQATWELVKDVRSCGDVLAARTLAHKGLRCREEGLFVANFALPIFDGTAWQNARHRAVLLGIPGVLPYDGALSLARASTRGLIVPWAAFEVATEQGNQAA